MTNPAFIPLSEGELNTLVSIAIRRAELLDSTGSPSACDAWREVMMLEQRLAEITSPEGISGGIARVGAVRAALAAGERLEARRLKEQYLAEDQLPTERRAALERVFGEDLQRRAQRLPALAKTGRLDEVDAWLAAASNKPHVFPLAA